MRQKLDIWVLHVCRKWNNRKKKTVSVNADATPKPHSGEKWSSPRLGGQLGVMHEPHCTLQATAFIADLMVCLISF